jgi:hypothetical protein
MRFAEAGEERDVGKEGADRRHERARGLDFRAVRATLCDGRWSNGEARVGRGPVRRIRNGPSSSVE